jgi:hypothetical protein
VNAPAPALDSFFADHPLSREIFEAVCQVVEAIGPAEIRVGKSQVAFRRRVNFALVWIPEQVLHRPAAPLVLTLSFRQRDSSPRWKQVVEISPARFTHHLELYTPEDVDAEVNAWLCSAWEAAG